MTPGPEVPVPATGDSKVGGRLTRRSRIAARWRRLIYEVKRPDAISVMLQIVKTVLAATGAWWVSVNLLESPLPFVAPWVALMAVHVTMMRTWIRGVQTAIASAVGVGMSFFIGVYLGVNVWTFALAMLVGLVGARLPGLRTEGIGIATTAIFVLAAGFDDQEPLLVNRLIEVGVGLSFAVVVNLVIVPPLHDREATTVVDSITRRMGLILTSMPEELSSSWDVDKAEEWFHETTLMREELGAAWGAVRFANESGRGNPRRRRNPLRTQRRDRGPGDDENIVHRVDDAVSHLRNLTHTLYSAASVEGEWDARFRKEWVEIVHDLGHAITDPGIEVEPLLNRLDVLARNMGDDEKMPSSQWPFYGSLITSVWHIIVGIGGVASSRKARERVEDIGYRGILPGRSGDAT